MFWFKANKKKRRAFVRLQMLQSGVFQQTGSTWEQPQRIATQPMCVILQRPLFLPRHGENFGGLADDAQTNAV